MNQPILVLCAAISVVSSSLAYAVTTNYDIEPVGSPPFGFYGGDLLVVNIGAQLSGQVSISIDDNTGAAELRLDNLIIQSVVASTFGQTVSDLPEEWTAEFYEGKNLAELDAFDSLIPGQRVSPTEIRFRPFSARDPLDPFQYIPYFNLTSDDEVYRLSGGSYHSDNYPNYYINAQLFPVPEPPALGCVVICLGCLAAQRRRAKLGPTSKTSTKY